MPLSGHLQSERDMSELTRRRVLGLAAGTIPALSLLVCGPSASAEDVPLADDETPFRWRVPAVHVPKVAASLEFRGDAVDERARGGPVVAVIFAGAVALVHLAEVLLAFQRDLEKGGVIIDARGDEVIIDTDRSLPHHMTVVLDPNGEPHFYERDSLVSVSDVLTAIGR